MIFGHDLSSPGVVAPGSHDVAQASSLVAHPGKDAGKDAGATTTSLPYHGHLLALRHVRVVAGDQDVAVCPRDTVRLQMAGSRCAYLPKAKIPVTKDLTERRAFRHGLAQVEKPVRWYARLCVGGHRGALRERERGPPPPSSWIISRASWADTRRQRHGDLARVHCTSGLAFSRTCSTANVGDSRTFETITPSAGNCDLPVWMYA